MRGSEPPSPLNLPNFHYESVDSISRDVGMSDILHRRSTLQTLEYITLGTLSCILNTTIMFYS